jgi:hypothetical protein
VRAAVNMLEPRSEVFEVRHTGFVTLQFRPPDGGGDGALPDGDAAADADKGGDGDGERPPAGWSLASARGGETGVFWLYDE